MTASSRQNPKGYVFVTVLMMISVMALITLSVISLQSSQSISVENEVRRLQAETLGLGALQIMLLNSSVATTVTLTQTMDGRTFTVSTSVTNNDSGPFSTDPMQVQVVY